MSISYFLPLIPILLLFSCSQESPAIHLRDMAEQTISLDLSGTMEPSIPRALTLENYTEKELEGTRPQWSRLRLINNTTRPIPAILCFFSKDKHVSMRRVLMQADQDNRLHFHGQVSITGTPPYQMTAYIGFDALQREDHDLHIHERDPYAQEIKFFRSEWLNEVSPSRVNQGIEVILQSREVKVSGSAGNRKHYSIKNLRFSLAGSLVLCRVLHDVPAKGAEAGGEDMILEGLDVMGFDLEGLRPELRHLTKRIGFQLTAESPSEGETSYKLRTPIAIKEHSYAPIPDPVHPETTQSRSSTRYLIYLPIAGSGTIRAHLQHGRGQRTIKTEDGKYHLVTIKATHD